MPPAVRGSIYWYDFGPVIGNELSGWRPALIISNTELNHGLSTAIALPMSSATPSGRHLQNHVFIEAAESWASVRQIKAVDQNKLGNKIADAAAPDLEKAVEILVARLVRSMNSLGSIQTQSGPQRMERGTIWEIPFRAQHGHIQPTQVLVLDYNNGNHMAIAVEVEYGRPANSRVRIPIEGSGTSQPASALVHRIKSVDVGARAVTKVGAVHGDSLETVGRTLLLTIDH